MHLPASTAPACVFTLSCLNSPAMLQCAEQQVAITEHALPTMFELLRKPCLCNRQAAVLLLLMPLPCVLAAWQRLLPSYNLHMYAQS